jgi:hypothetical protein
VSDTVRYTSKYSVYLEADIFESWLG